MKDQTPLTYEHLVSIWGKEAADHLMSKSELVKNIGEAKSYFEKLLSLKKYYKANEASILNTFQQNKCLWYSSYPTDWSQLQTPIEEMAWMSIRSKGRIVLYPQYPILNYYADFANPGLKIALELDGEQYHNEERDRRRDAQLQGAGWTVIRITGKEMWRTDFKYVDDWEQDYHSDQREEDEIIPEVKDWLCNTGDGVIEAIKQIYFSPRRHFVTPTITEWYNSYCHLTLENHQY